MGTKDVCNIFLCNQEIVERQKGQVRKVEGLSAIFKILADETRLKIIYALSNEKELCVCEIATIIETSIATASHHLRLLKKMDVANYRKDGKLVYYSLNNDELPFIINKVLKHQETGEFING